MPDLRAMNALSMGAVSARETLRAELRRAGYDPDELEELPDPTGCGCPLAGAIRQWHHVLTQLDAAAKRQSGWRY